MSVMEVWRSTMQGLRRRKTAASQHGDPDFAGLLGMTTPSERAWLWRYGRRGYLGKGAVIDLGCWLGSTTIPLLDGLSGNPKFRRLGAPVHVYDSFVWEAWMDPVVAGTGLAGRFAPGDSFQKEFESRAKAYEADMLLHAGDLAAIGWSGGSIEFLLVDAMKSWDLARAILHSFYPSLVPGVSVVFHQDFCHYYTYWIHLIQFRLREWFVCEEDVCASPGTAFRNTGRIPSEVLTREWSKTDLSAAEVEDAFAYSMGLVRAENREPVLAAKIMCLADMGFGEKARSELETAKAAGCCQYDIKAVESIVVGGMAPK